jgi:hypothetical protein
LKANKNSRAKKKKKVHFLKYTILSKIYLHF